MHIIPRYNTKFSHKKWGNDMATQDILYLIEENSISNNDDKIIWDLVLQNKKCFNFILNFFTDKNYASLDSADPTLNSTIPKEDLSYQNQNYEDTQYNSQYNKILLHNFKLKEKIKTKDKTPVDNQLLNLQDFNPKYLLHYMAQAEHWDMCLALLVLGFDPSEPNEDGVNCFDIVKGHGYLFHNGEMGREFLRICSERENPNVQARCEQFIQAIRMPKLLQEAIDIEKTVQARVTAIVQAAETDYSIYLYQTRVKFREPVRFTLHQQSSPQGFSSPQPQGLLSARHQSLSLGQPQRLSSNRPQNIVTDDQIIRELGSSLSHHSIFKKIKKIPRYENFCAAAEEFWKALNDGDKRNHDKKTFADNPPVPITFNLDQFSLDYRDFAGELFFSRTVKELVKSLQSENGIKLRSSHTYQTIAQHQTLMWAMSNIHRRKYFTDLLKRSKKHTWIVEDIYFDLIDLTQDVPENDYTFLGHTTSGNLNNLEALFSKNKSFIHDTPFFSCSLIDRDTPAAKMNHQEKVIFHLSIILDVAEDAVLKAFPCDAWSPMLSKENPVSNKERISKRYLEYIKKDKEFFLGNEVFIRALSLQTESSVSTSLSTLDTSFIHTNMSNLVVPTLDQHGKMPSFMPHQLLQATKHAFNEVIVAGNPQNKILGICVEEDNLKSFKERFSELGKEQQEKARLSLRFLAKAKVPIVLVKTHPNFKHNKQDLRDQFKGLLDRRGKVISDLSKLYLAQSRLQFDKNPNQGKQLGFKYASMAIDLNLQTLQEIHDESAKLINKHKHKKVSI